MEYFLVCNVHMPSALCVVKCMLYVLYVMCKKCVGSMVLQHAKRGENSAATTNGGSTEVLYAMQNFATRYATAPYLTIINLIFLLSRI